MSLLRGIKKIIQVSIYEKKRLTDIENKLVATKEEGEGVKAKLEVWD